VQYQFVLPDKNAYEGLMTILEILSKNQLGSFLAVLKKFGEAKENRFLHFPLEGYTLALDIKVSSKVWPILDELDKVVNSFGGKIYLTKDARMKAESFFNQYPNRPDFSNKFMSYQFERLMTKNENIILVLGANSDIAKEMIKAYYRQSPETYFILASKNTKALAAFVADNNLINHSSILYFDATDLSSHASFVERLPQKPKCIIYAAGILIDNDSAFKSIAGWIEATMVNVIGAVSILNELVKANNANLERIIGLSTIAALRGRKSNFMYGASKAGFHAYLFGLRQRLKDRHVLVQAVTPGFVDTKMTKHFVLPKNAVQPEKIAKAVLESNNTNFEIYPNLYWRIVGNLVKILPEFVISKL
jgi:NADP-dependent 3-hydroxy acid dehydrogenase YdfG